MTAPNIVTVKKIYGKTSALLVTDSATAIIENTSGSGKVLKINSLIIGNIDASTSYDITVDFYRSSTAYRFANTIAVPAKASLDVIQKSIYLEEGDSLRLTGSTSLKLEAVCSYEEIS